MNRIFKVILLVGLLFNVSTMYGQTPTYYWSMDNTTVTGGASALGVTGHNQPYWVTDRKIGTMALRFYLNNGVTTNCPRATSSNVTLNTTGIYSASIWVNPGAFTNVYPTLGTSNVMSIANQFEIQINQNGYLLANVYGSPTTNNVKISSPSPIILNRWSHIALVVDKPNSLVNLYLNGIMVASSALSFMPAATTSSIIFGALTSASPATWFDGTIDDAKIFNGTALTPNQCNLLASENPDPDYNWQFNDDYKDFIGFAHATNLYGEITTGVRGSGAVCFPTNYGWVQTPSLSVTDNGSFSLSTWINPTANPTSAFSIIRKTNTSNQFLLTMNSAGKISFTIYDNNGTATTVNSTNPAPLNKWTNIVATVSNNGSNNAITLYLNGVAESTVNFNNAIKNISSYITIGNDAVQTNNSFKGKIDDVRIYKNKSLPVAEISKIVANLEIPDAQPAPYLETRYWKSPYRTLHYEPNFTPGVVTFDEKNHPYIIKNTTIQTMDDAGNWVIVSNFVTALNNLVPGLNCNDQQTYTAGSNVNVDTHVVFDDDNWAYVYYRTIGYTTLSPYNGRNVLLYSTDHCKTWKFILLKQGFTYGRFEKRTQFNEMSRPPILIQCAPSNPNTGTGNDWPMTLTTFTKNLTTNTLTSIDKDITTGSVGLCEHAGAGNMVITKDNKSIIVYGTSNKTIPNGTSPIGQPAWAVTLDRTTNTLSSPVYIGQCGDNTGQETHNYPSITIDSRGYIHALLVGHQTKWIIYTRTLKPNDARAWTTPIKVATENTTNGGSSYVSLVCDKNDVLHCITRFTGFDYVFAIGYMKKEPGKNWTPMTNIYTPFEGFYSTSEHKLNLDRLGNLYLNSVYAHQQVSLPAYNAYLVEWPEENVGATVLPPSKTAVTAQETKFTYHNPQMMLLPDASSTWSLSASLDFKSKLLNGTLPFRASIPTPTDLSFNPTTSITALSWTAGTGATSHKIYLGTDSILTESHFKAEQAGTTFNVSLLSDTKYYWRINEKNAVGTTTGYTWTFKTPIVNAINNVEFGNSELGTFKIKPNPAIGGKFELVGEASVLQSIDVEVYNSIGIRVDKVKMDHSGFGYFQHSFDCSNYKSGVYYLRLSTQKQIRNISVIVK